MEEPTFYSNLQEVVINFLSGREFLVATGVFVAYLFLTGMLRRIKNGIFGFFGAVVRIFSPFRLRAVAVNGLSLLFMTASFSLFAGARAGLNGGDARLNAILGGSLAVALWSLGLFTFHQIRGPQKPVKKKKKKYQPTTSKVTPPSSML